MTDEPNVGGDVVSVPDDPVQGLEEGAAEGSILDTFKRELQELSTAETVFIPVKGYEGTGLQIRYHMPEGGKQLDAVSRRIAREFKDTYSRNLYTAVDTMIALCDGIYVQPEGVTEPEMLDPNNTGFPCTFDATLAELMGMNGASGNARQVLGRLFGGNEIAIMAHAERLSRWLQNTKADVEAEIWQLGE